MRLGEDDPVQRYYYFFAHADLGIITDEEFKAQLSAERENYPAYDPHQSLPELRVLILLQLIDNAEVPKR